VPRAGLSTAAVVSEAADVADERGLDRLTLAAVADRLGVRLPSLYKHVAGLDALRREIAIRSLGELGAELRTAAVGRSGSVALLATCAAYRDYARAHPGRYASTLRAPSADDPELVAAAERVLATVLAVLAGYGLHGADAIDAARGLRAVLHGFATLETAGGFGLPQDVDRSFDRLVLGFDGALTRW
jgi:AcrR family transcriptional regulator